MSYNIIKSLFQTIVFFWKKISDLCKLCRSVYYATRKCIQFPCHRKFIQMALQTWGLNSLCFCFVPSKRFISTSGEVHMGKCLRKLIYLNELVGILNLWLRTNSLRKGQYKRIFEDKKLLDDRADLGK